MNESENIELVVQALAKVPPKSLLIIELVNRFTKDGQLDLEGLAEVQPEVNRAIAEAKMYGSRTMMVVNTLKGLESRVDGGTG